MKFVLVAALFVACVCGWIRAQEKSVAGESPEIIPGTRVSMKRPSGFERAERFSGFQDEETGSSIMITEMPFSFDDLTSGFTSEKLRTKGMVPVSRSDVEVHAGKGVLLQLRQQAYGRTFLKWMLLCGSETRSVMITATFPEQFQDQVSAKLKRSVMTAQWFGERAVDRLAGLPFTIEENESLPLAGRAGNTLSFAKDGLLPVKEKGDPYFIVGLSVADIAAGPAARKAYAESRARQTAMLEAIEIRSIRPVSISGLSGYELEAVGDDSDTGRKTVLYQVMLFDEKGYVLMQGLVEERKQGNFPTRFRSMARSYRPIRHEATRGAEAERKGEDPDSRTEPRWRKLEEPTAEMLVGGQFLDPMTGFFVGGDRETGAAVLIATHDGGRSWRRVAVDLSARLYDVHFPTRKVGYAVGFGGAALKTVDGGERFERLPAAPRGWLASVHFLTADVGFVAGGAKDGVGLWTTRDGGRTWASLRERLPATARDGSLREILFLDDRVGFAVGAPGLILRTTDAGKTWHTRASGTDAWLRAVTFVSPRVGFVGGSGGVVLRTEDGGETWMRRPGHPAEKITDLHFLDARQGFSATAAGRLLETRDGGRSWVERHRGRGELNVLAFPPNSKSGYAAGARGMLLERSAR